MQSALLSICLEETQEFVRSFLVCRCCRFCIVRYACAVVCVKPPERSIHIDVLKPAALTPGGSSTRDEYFHSSFVKAICAKHGNSIKGLVDAWDADGTKYQYIASMSQDEIDPVLIPEKIEPLGRNFQHCSFVYVCVCVCALLVV